MSPAPSVLSDGDVQTFIDGPVSILLGTADRLRTPDATRVAGLALVGGARVRLLISTDALDAHANAVVGARVCVLVTDITTYRSLQWKGSVVQGCAPRTAGDLALMHRHVDAFCAAAPSVGMSQRAAVGIFPVDVVALEIELDVVYDQTPGVGAGRRVG